MYGKFNPDIFCRVIEQIFSERNENIEVKVRLITEEEAEELTRQQDKNHENME
jgi:hypothetical protein